MSESDGQEASVSGSSLHSSSKNYSSHEDGSGSSTTGTSVTGSSTRGPPTKEEEIARSEDRAVAYSKVLVLAVLLVSATAAGVLTWIFSTNAEEEEFRTQFKDFAIEIGDISQNNAETAFGLIGSFSATITSFALSTASEWPHITVPHFEVRGEHFLNISSSQLLSFAPIVSNLETWSSYSVANQNWIQESYELRGDTTSPAPIESEVYYRHENGSKIPEKGKAEYAPLWQEARAPSDTSSINFNLMSHEVFDKVFSLARQVKTAVLSEVFDPATLLGEAALFKDDNGEVHPESILVQPVFDEFDEEIRSVVGAVVAVLPWDIYFENLLHDGAEGLVCVMRDTCGDVFSYRIDGPHAKFLGKGDHHDSEYDSLEFAVPFAPFVDFSDADDDSVDAHCEYTLHIYPTQDLEAEYHTSKPAVFTSVVVLVFFFTSVVFMIYDSLVQRRQVKVHTAAVKSNAIVSSLFPAEIRDRLFQQQNESDNKGSSGKNGLFDATTSKLRQKSFLENEEDDEAQTGGANHSSPDMYDTKPIADLFPNTTVMFADIAGFTAWSSVREPCQVFTLLETVYRAFDMMAKRRRVFKVETIGDCYVAVTGLPEPRKDHAVAMSRFARDCLIKMNELCRRLEVTLGPDTGDLCMRIGLHSGPVTAGVLRGEKSRFQLFGDTVNTAARVESTGMRNRIHISEETANLLETASKGHWIKPREDLVHAKGKGELKTFWLICEDAAGGSERNGGTPTSDVRCSTMALTSLTTSNPEIPETVVESAIPEKTELSPKMLRLVDWNAEVLQRLLKLIIAKRSARTISRKKSPEAIAKKERDILMKDGMVLDEVEEIVTLPNFDAAASKNRIDPGTVQIPPKVAEQLREYVKSIASQYRNNPFHNFEHASHVTMSVSKLLSRIAAPDIDETDQNLASSLHDHTYGITSDPLTQFAVVLSALIHDVDHVGVPNFLLVEENAGLATTYKNKSVAEQNSVDLAWKTLMEPSFAELRNCIYDDTADLKRFRQLVVNTVLATDIFDKELQTLRKSRWAKAFDHDQNAVSGKQEDVNRRATIVIEHLIQASDVAHTMQHWHIYQKWNERLFNENYLAYKAGRSPKDPSGGWYQGELGFFDNYIIPLAKKLQNCGVFGVSSDEYLNYALENRREWATKGEEVVQKMMRTHITKEDEDPATEDAKPSSGSMIPTELSSPSHSNSNLGGAAEEQQKVPIITPANASPYNNADH